MNKLKHAIRNAEVDGLSDTLVRLFKADEGAQSDAFLSATMADLETLSAQITYGNLAGQGALHAGGGGRRAR